MDEILEMLRNGETVKALKAAGESTRDAEILESKLKTGMIDYSEYQREKARITYALIDKKKKGFFK